MARTYNQDCVLALALDLLGERWTFLILRDLLLGPRRFADLQAGLPGIGANLLSKRLKELEEAGLIESLHPGEARGGYTLSAQGAALRPAIRALMRWSIKYFKSRPDADQARECINSNNLQPDSVALVIELLSEHSSETELSYVARVRIDGFPYTVYYMNKDMTVRRGDDAPAVAEIRADVPTLMKAFRGELSRQQAEEKMTLEGDARAIDHLMQSITHLEGREDGAASIIAPARSTAGAVC